MYHPELSRLDSKIYHQNLMESAKQERLARKVSKNRSGWLNSLLKRQENTTPLQEEKNPSPARS